MLVDARYIYNILKNQRPVALYSEYARALTFENFKVSRPLLTEGNGGGEGGGKIGGGRGEGGGGGGKRYYTCEHRNAVSVLKKRWTHHELRHLCWTHPRVAKSTGVLRKKKGFHDPSKKKPNCVPPKKVSGDSDIDPFFVDIGKFWKC